jgi:REP element-mobilizing transposase RayT
MSDPLAYFITFHCYGTWLHGEERGSVDSAHNRVGDPLLPPDPQRRLTQLRKMNQPAYNLDSSRQAIVLRAIREVCVHRGWRLWALHVRVTHVHVVVTADCRPEKVMGDFKSYASRALNDAGLDEIDRQRWSRHGSTRYLNAEDAVVASVDYVLRGQGTALTVYDGTVREPPPLPDGRGS